MISFNFKNGTLVILLILITSAATNGVNDDILGVLAVGYTRNRESFPVFDCRFEWRDAKAATIEDALAGKFISEAKPLQGHWLVDEENVRYELMCTPEMRKEAEDATENPQITEQNEKFEIPIPCADNLYLRNKSYLLSYGPLTLAANLFGPSDPRTSGVRITPFNPDIMGTEERSSPDRFLRACLSGRFVGHFDGTEKINGVDVLAVTIGERPGPDGKLVGHKYGFDPDRGHLPVYISDRSPQSGKLLYEAYITEAREFSGERWFPTRVVLILAPESEPPYQLKELKVSKLDVDLKPSIDRFNLELASGTQVNVIGRTEWTFLKEDESFTVNDLPALHQRCIAYGQAFLEREKKAKEAGNQPAVERTATIKYLIIGNGCILVIVAILFFLMWKRRRNKNNE
ncbi:hypothetical protein [Gimesia sp.]